MKKYSYTDVEQLGIEIIRTNLKDNLLNLIYETVTELSEGTSFEYPEELNHIVASLKNHIIGLADTLALPVGERTDFINGLLETKSALISFTKPIQMYLIPLTKLQSKFHRKFQLCQLQSLDKFPVDTELFMEDMSDFLSQMDGNFLKKYQMGSLLSLIPLRMTRDKFSDYVKASFIQTYTDVPEDMVQSTIELFKQKFFPTGTVDYGKHFAFIKDETERLDLIDITNISEDECEKLLSSVDELIDTLSDITSQLNMYYNHLNYIYNVVSFAIDEDYMFEDDYTIKDMYCSMCDMLKTGEYEAFSDSVLTTTSDKLDEIYDDLEAREHTFEKFIADLDNRPADSIPESTNIVIGTYKFIKENYYSEITDSLITSKSKTPSTKEFVEKIADEFISFLNSAISDKPISEQKYIKQEFLSSLLCPYTDEEFLDYVAFAIDGAGTSDSAYIAYFSVFDFYESNGYTPYRLNEDEDNHYDHHHGGHKHDCDCGHHHDGHEDDCSCGHHHH